MNIFFFLFKSFRISSYSQVTSNTFRHMRTVPIFLFWDRIVGYKTHYATAVILPDSDRHIESLGFWELFDWILLSRPIIYLY